MSDFAIVPGPDDGFVELSSKATGRRFKKHLLSEGELLYPGVRGGKVKVDAEFLNTIKRNFDNNVCSIVQVPLAGPKNEHTEDPERNIGRVVELSVEDGKLYAIADVRKHADDIGSTLLGASAMLALNYKDTRTGENAGPTLLHMAVTNRPYVVGLEDYEEVIAASGDSIDEAVVLTAHTKEESMDLTLDEMFDALKVDHGIDVPALQDQAEKAAKAEEVVAQLSNLVSEVSGIVRLSNAEATPEEVLSAVTSLAEENVELSNRLEAMDADARRKDAEARVDALISEGRILEMKRDANVELCLSNTELFEALLPEKAIINLSGEEVGFEKVDESPEAEIDSEISRLTSNYVN